MQPHLLRISRALLLPVVLLALTPHTFAAPPGKTLLDKVKDAYAKIDTYQATLQIDEHYVFQGKKVDRHVLTMHVAFDRTHHQLKIDDGITLIIVDQGLLRMRTAAIPGQYLSTKAPKPLTYQAVIAKTKIGPTGLYCPDLAMLLAPNPITLLSKGASQKAVSVLLPHHQDMALQFTSQDAVNILTLDKADRIAEMHVTENKRMLAQQHLTSAHADIICKPSIINKPLAKDTFTFKTMGLKPANSVRQMRQNAQGPVVKRLRAALKAQAGGGAAHAMAGALAKPIALPKLKLTDPQGKHVDLQTQHASSVIVLSFWASWSNDCMQKLLPMTEHLHDWASKQHKDIAIYAVDMGEAAKEVIRFWKQKHYKVPLLLDEQVQAGTALNIDSIPCIVVIVDGKVRIIDDNLTPKTEANLTTTLTDLLNQAATTSQTPKGLD